MMRRVAAGGVSVVCLDDSTYPAQLKQIYDPPLILYVRGNVEAIAHPGSGVVGTRHPTPNRLGMAGRMACDLANRGLVIFSGLARALTLSRIAAPSTPRGKRSRFSTPAWTLFIPRKTAGSRSRCWPWAAP
jgi:DNA recombination-mediator protein A